MSQIVGTKIVLVGDGGTGKSTYVNRLLTGDFRETYVPTLGVDVHPYLSTFTLNEKGVLVVDSSPEYDSWERKFNVWDTAGQENFGGLREGYYIGAEAGIVFCDVHSSMSIKNVKGWVNELRAKIGDAPICVCLNKFDIKAKNAKKTKAIIEKEKKSWGEVKVFDFSCKSRHNLFKPLEWIDDQLSFF